MVHKSHVLVETPLGSIVFCAASYLALEGPFTEVDVDVPFQITHLLKLFGAIWLVTLVQRGILYISLQPLFLQNICDINTPLNPPFRP